MTEKYSDDDLTRARAEAFKLGRAEAYADEFQKAFEQAYAAAIAEGRAAGGVGGFALGATAERERVKAILEAPEARGRKEVALHFALNTDITPAAARGALATIRLGSSIGEPAADTVKEIDEFTLQCPPPGASHGP